MKIFALIIILIASTIDVIAQDYLINFSGTGSSTTVETVTVENLTQGKSITLSGLKTLHLVGTVTGNSPLLEYMDYPMIVYPNPSSGDLSVQFEAQKFGMVTVTIYDLIGREINHLRQNVQVGFQSFKVAGLSNGVYTLQVLLENQKFTQKVICNSKSTSATSISYNGFSEAKQKDVILKNATTEQAWQYNTGDRLKFQGTSGKYSTIVMDVPALSKTLSFDFVECTDADGNNYPVVKIGNQLWMAENLKTTKYNDGTPILNETDNLKWANLTDGAYCWYNNDINNKAVYGAIYNWNTVNTSKLAPNGWHIASISEWGFLISHAGGDPSKAGGKLKEVGLKNWLTPNLGATNEFGFNALPGGLLQSIFGGIGYQGNWWTSSEYDNISSWNINIGFGLSHISRNSSKNQFGYSVRCIKNVSEKPSMKFVSNAPKYSYPNNTVGQIKSGYFSPGFYVSDDFSQNSYDILGILENSLRISHFRYWDASSVYFDYNNDGFLDMFAFVTNFRDEPYGSKNGKYLLVKDVLSDNPEKIYTDCTTRYMPHFEVSDVNNDGVLEIIQYSQDGHGLSDGTNGANSPLKIISFQPNGTLSIKEVGEPMDIHDMTSGDIDNDGDVDIIVVSIYFNISGPAGAALYHGPLIYTNDGKGNFKLEDQFKRIYGLSEIIKQLPDGRGLSTYVPGTMEVFDIDGDGNLDYIASPGHNPQPENDYTLYHPSSRIYWGKGDGTFNFKTEYTDLPNNYTDDFSVFNSPLGYGFFDFDNDGDYDIITSVTADYGGCYLQLHENLGNRRFKDATKEKIEGYANVYPRNGGVDGDFPPFYNPRICDIDQDGDFDIIPGSLLSWTMFQFSPNLYWENVGGKFVRRNK